MLDLIDLNNRACEVKGRVMLEYTDALTGRVKERIESKNHVFEDSFKTTNWWAVLSNNINELLFLTDEHTPSDDSLPYLKGNIIGWGRRGQPSSGERQGQSVDSESFYDRVMVNNQLGWRHVYEFTSSQVPEDIKTIGLTNQYATSLQSPEAASITGESLMLRSNRIRRISPGSNPMVFKDNVGYRIATREVTMYGGLTRVAPGSDSQTATVDIPTSMVPTPSGTITYHIGVSANTPNCYILVHSTTAANSRLYEFADNNFDTVTNAYTVSNFGAVPRNNIFVVYENEMVFYRFVSASDWGLCAYNFVENTASRYLNTAPCPLNTNGYISTSGSQSAMSFGLKDNLLFPFSASAHAFISSPSKMTRRRYPIWDLRTMTQYGSIGEVYHSTSATPIHCDLDPSLMNRCFLLNDPTTGLWGSMKQALCCYSPVPFPSRPANTGLKVTYNIVASF